MDSVKWEDVLAAKCFMLNMDRCKDRLEVAVKRCNDAGFKEIERFRGVDAHTDDLSEAWKEHGSPPFDHSDKEFTVQFIGKQGCALGHYGIWKKMIAESIPYAVIFEDDVEFHKDWNELAPQYWDKTPKDFDILYFGSQLEMPVSGNIVVASVFCTHAYFLTLDGARKLYDLCVNEPRGTRTIDWMILDKMNEYFASKGQYKPFTWYVWNSYNFVDPKAYKCQKWAKRNTGLVFQDADFGTFVHPI